MRRLAFFVELAEVLVSPAFAHTGAGQLASFYSGIAHPFGGADHILTMTFVRIWSVLTGGRAVWAWPAAFVAAMLGGFAAAILGLEVPFVEPVIFSSIVVFGSVIAFGLRAPTGLGAVIVGLFSFFHGHAHGTEASANLLPYASGFVLATVVLLAAGAGLGFCARSLVARVPSRSEDSAILCEASSRGKLP